MAGKPKWITEFTPEAYRRAATDHVGSLQCLYDNQEFVLTVYVAGLAVECMFRAFRGRIDSEFDSRHDLYELAKEAKFAEWLPVDAIAKYHSDLGIVATRWSNNHRFRSEDSLRKMMKRGHFDRKIKGDFLKENARRMFNASSDLVTLGDGIWMRK